MAGSVGATPSLLTDMYYKAIELKEIDFGDGT